jgi:CheY-like chemotaxis protein
MQRRILLVEDDADFREVFTHALRQALAPERLDVAFVEAGSLAEARARLREGGLDAALIDVTMPDGNGLELVGEINDGGAGNPIPTMVLTASLDTSVAGRAMESGAMGALSKLAAMTETAEAIKRLTGAGRSEVRARSQMDETASPASPLLTRQPRRGAMRRRQENRHTTRFRSCEVGFSAPRSGHRGAGTPVLRRLIVGGVGEE